MIKSISNRITSFLVCNKSIESEDSEVCSYGLEILISSLINLAVTLIFGAIFGKFIQTVVFVICYCSIRQYSGGYHATTHRKCIFTFLCMYLATVFVAGEIDFVYLRSIVVLIGVVNWLNIYLLVPVEHMNNPLSDFEKDKNKKNARRISTLILICICIGSFIYSVYEYIIYGVLALCWVNFMLILQVVNNRRKTKDEEIF